VAAGFEGFELIWRKDVFQGAARPSADAAAFGTRGVTFRAFKPQPVDGLDTHP
jgi:hypothetical protein